MLLAAGRQKHDRGTLLKMLRHRCSSLESLRDRPLSLAHTDFGGL